MRRWYLLHEEVYEDLAAKGWADFKAELHKAQDWAIQQMAKKAERLGANAVIGVRIDYKTIDIDYKNMVDEDARAMMLIATGIAVRL